MNESPLYRTEEGNFVRFTWSTAKNEAASEKEGRPIFDKVLMATVVSPGMNKQEVVHEVERHFSDNTVRRGRAYDRFAPQLSAWERQADNPELTGTPLDHWPALDVRQVAELRALNIHTVEALANLSDTGLQRVGMGARELQSKAKAFLEHAKGTAPAQHLAAELERRDQEIADLKRQIAELATRSDEEDAPRRRGRPPSQPAAA